MSTAQFSLRYVKLEEHFLDNQDGDTGPSSAYNWPWDPQPYLVPPPIKQNAWTYHFLGALLVQSL